MAARPTEAQVVQVPQAQVVQMPKQMEVIGGAIWEYTSNFDCWGHDLKTFPVHSWGQNGAIEDREMCAKACLDMPACVSFNFPMPGFPGNRTRHKYDPQVCYLKSTRMHSTKLGLSCEKGFNSEIWTYYSLIGDQVWRRETDGLFKERWPFEGQVVLPSALDSRVTWIGEVRYLTTQGDDCFGSVLMHEQLQVGASHQKQLEACSARCTAEQDCIAFGFPELPKTGTWDEKANGPFACVLKKGTEKKLEDMNVCNTTTGPWKHYTLIDAWHMHRNHHHEYVRKPLPPRVWSGEVGNPCNDLKGVWVEELHGVNANVLQTRRLILPDASQKKCCLWSAFHCEANLTASCEPVESFPLGCKGLCSASKAMCACYTEEQTPADDCCTSCGLDCDGQATCHPAGCAGPQKMCPSRLGRGSACSCTAPPPDVAAGWDPKKRVWVVAPPAPP